MAFKFFNIGKANEEIDNLTSSIAALTLENQSLKDNSPLIEAEAEKLKGEFSAVSGKLSQVEADLATSKQTISTLSGELKVATDKLANPSAQIQKAASVQAAAIVASAGHAAIEVVPTGNTSEKQVSRAAFAGMIPGAQSAFIKSGGRVTE